MTDDAKEALKADADWLKQYAQWRIKIEGHAALDGEHESSTREYALAIGVRRANAVQSFLVAQGIAASRIETISYGNERPVDPKISPEAAALNRNARVAPYLPGQ